MADSDWSKKEVDLIVSIYFNMLSNELMGLSYSKAEHRRSLLPMLDNRTEGAIEFKHQNISAILVELGQPFIKGYLPRYNYQLILKDAVIDFLNQNLTIEKQFKSFAENEFIKTNSKIDFLNFVIEPPKSRQTFEPKVFYTRNPIKVNYLEKEQRNNRLGELGEKLAFEYERWYLIRLGKENFADKVEWISKDIGDGAGFDILSRNMDGTDKYIEVKTTKLSKETPIFFSKNELDFSIDHQKGFNLYRLFDFENNARMFTRQGALNQICQTEAINFRGYF